MKIRVRLKDALILPDTDFEKDRVLWMLNRIQQDDSSNIMMYFDIESFDFDGAKPLKAQIIFKELMITGQSKEKENW